MRHFLIALALVIVGVILLVRWGTESHYAYEIREQTVDMRDGVKIALTLFVPVTKNTDERFPVLLEMHPYRKDDLFWARDRSLYDYFAKRGFIMAKADVRGTGTSTGPVPKEEYSDEELADGEELIQWLSGLPESNGKVGMWGISWSGFNALMIAMRKPPALKGVLAAHASDDLYKDDVHYVDGIFHMDEYMLNMNHEVALPRPPEYEIDEAYIKDRLESYPWILTYLREQRDGQFWRKKSVRFQPENIEVPVFLIGGLLDSYRDSIPRMLSYLKVPVHALMGPYGHEWPDNGSPGPRYEWRAEAVKWWNALLRDQTNPPSGNHFTFFVRDRHKPTTNLSTLPGFWCGTEGARAQRTKAFHLTANRRLSETPETPPDFAPLTFHYDPGAGTALGFYWGELTGDMKNETDGTLVFESDPLEEDFVMAGTAQVAFETAVNRPLVHFVARLEDRRPDGHVNLVTGAAINGSQRKDRLSPEGFSPDKQERIAFDLHFSTWTFHKGHRVRLVIANGSFPMLWPTPGLATTKIYPENARLELPLLSHEETTACEAAVSKTQNVEPRPKVAGFWEDPNADSWPSRERVYSDESWKILEAHGANTMKLRGWTIAMREFGSYKVDTKNPAFAAYNGWMEHEYTGHARKFTLRTELSIRSDSRSFYVDVKRLLSRPGEPSLERTWKGTFVRDWQ